MAHDLRLLTSQTRRREYHDLVTAGYVAIRVDSHLVPRLPPALTFTPPVALDMAGHRVRSRIRPVYLGSTTFLIVSEDDAAVLALLGLDLRRDSRTTLALLVP